MWNYQNYPLQSTNRTTKMEILNYISKRGIYHYNICMTYIPHICHLLFQITIHTLLYIPVIHILSLIAVVSSARISSQRRDTKGTLDTDRILLILITNVRIIPYPSKFEESLPLQTTSCIDPLRSVFIEQEDDPNHAQDISRNRQIKSI